MHGSRTLTCICWMSTVSPFCKIGKATFWPVWLAKVKPGDTTLSIIFKEFSKLPMNIYLNEFDTLRNFVYKAYGLTKQTSIKMRKTDHFISMPNGNIWMLLPSPSGILLHIKQVFIQAGYFWRLSEIETIPDPIDWDWKPLPDGLFVPRFQNQGVTDNIKPIIASCSCLNVECSNCSCKKSSIKCLVHCKCDKG